MITIDYFTDPLCCWSWAFEPQWTLLRDEYGHALTWRYRMGGLIAGWDQFSDPLNGISRPSQMAPLWYHAAAISGMPVDERVWLRDPPASSYPACLAVKAAERQDRRLGERMLRQLREAGLRDGRNVARVEGLEDVARRVATTDSSFDVDRFSADLQSADVADALGDDLREGRWRGIERFPALVLRRDDTGRAIGLVGYRPYDVLRDALPALAPELAPRSRSLTPSCYADRWGPLTERELAEAFPTGDVSQAATFPPPRMFVRRSTRDASP